MFNDAEELRIAQEFAKPVLDDLKSEFKKAGINLYPISYYPRPEDTNKFELCLVIGYDNPQFDEGETGDEILRRVSRKHKQYLGLGFTESIGTCATTTNSMRLQWPK